MTGETRNITPVYSRPSLSPGDHWLRMVQVDLEDDTALVGEVADLLDTLFELEPCSRIEGEGGVAVEVVPPTEEVFNQKLMMEMAFAACAVDYDGSYEVEIKTYRSHRDIPFKLVPLNGEYISTEHRKEFVTVSVLVDENDSLKLRYPVLSGFTYTWSGAIYDVDGPCAPPVIERVADVLDFKKKITGKLTCSFETEYEIVTCKIYGENGAPATGHVVAFYNHAAYEQDVEKPLIDGISDIGCPGRPCPDGLLGEEVECFEILKYYGKCTCTGKEDSELEHESAPQSGTCPESIQDQYGFTQWLCAHNYGPFYFERPVFDGYSECEDNHNPDGVNPADPAWYAEKCGEPPPEGMVLPRCMTVYDVWRGGLDDGQELTIENGEDYYRSAFGDKTEFQMVMPRNGECGEWVKNYGCAELTWYGPANPEMYTGVGGSFFVNVGAESHDETITYEISDGEHFYADAEKTTKEGEATVGSQWNVANSEWITGYVLNVFWDFASDSAGGLSGWEKIQTGSPDIYETVITVTVTNPCGDYIAEAVTIHLHQY